MVARPSESEEWLAGKVDSWVETYKKSMLTPVILSVVAAQQPASIATVGEAVHTATGWRITERGLYRTLRRLEDSGLLISAEVAAPRTGAKRKELSLSPLGDQFLGAVRSHLVELPGTASESTRSR